jgi:hypothetical protein
VVYLIRALATGPWIPACAGMTFCARLLFNFTGRHKASPYRFS